MTPRRASERFDDVLRVAALARELSERGREAFESDRLLQLAGERIIELVAEAVGAAVDELEAAYPDYPWHEPVGMRNIITHEYWRTDPDLVWETIAEDIPEVAQMVRSVSEARSAQNDRDTRGPLGGDGDEG